MPAIDPETQGKLNDLELNLKKIQLSHDAQLKEIEKAAALNKEKDLEISKLKSDMVVLNQKVLDLTKSLDDAAKSRPMIEVGELTRQLKGSIETLNNEAKQKSKDGTSQIMIDQFDVEIKGGLDLKDGLRITQLQGPELSPLSVSTIRFALKPVPIVTIVDDSNK
jgi:hypothetical protein